MMRANELSDALTANIEIVSESLLGPRNKAKSTASTWRWGRNGSLAVEINGPKRGCFYTHERGKGGDSLDLVRHAIGGSLVDAMRWASDWLGDTSTPAPVRAAPRAEPKVDDDAERERVNSALRIWSQAVDINGTLAESYLNARGIILPEYVTDLRFHPKCPDGTARTPAMIALLRDAVSNAPRAIHRTFIEAGSPKAISKKVLGPSAGTVIKLADDAEVTMGLGICEGIENALTMASSGWWPIWAAPAKNQVKAFPVLDGIEMLTIFADNKKPDDLEAARDCAIRWSAAGKTAEILAPPEGTDWNKLAADLSEVAA